MSAFTQDKKLESASDWMGPAEQRSEPPIAERHLEHGGPGQTPNHEPAHTLGSDNATGRGLADLDTGGPAGLGQSASGPGAGHFPGDADGCVENSYRGDA